MEVEDDIAIVGIGCRFPGADNIDEFWRVLENGENHVLDIPMERWNNEAFYSDNNDEQGKHYVKKAGFISRHDEWDNRLFGVSENEAYRIDPQQRYVLECTHMAMEDGGITRKDLSGSQTAVYIGVMNDDYKALASADHNDGSNYSATGMSTTIIASRVSYVYNLQGPCMVVDTACSSSMIAIHLGCQAIRTGDCEMAICGGVSSIISPDTFIPLCRARMMSPTGQCQTFCDTADGYARGEGCGIVMLKRVKQALKDGNKIWGILKTGINQDGHAMTPITAPSGEQQEELLNRVYTHYNVDPTSLQYIEAHGTGTPIGDPTEANALGRFITLHREKSKTNACDDIGRRSSFFSIDSGLKSDTDTDTDTHTDTSDSEKEMSGSATDKDDVQEKIEHQAGDSDKETILIGSVKSNIGHTESAAGVAALIKVLLMMKHEKIVPSLHVKKDKSNLNKKIKLEEYGLNIALDVEHWKPNTNGDRISCVNSFGFGGSNSHAIVIQKMCFQQHQKQIFDKSEQNNHYKVFCLSAMDKTSLKGTMDNFSVDIQASGLDHNDISYSSAYHRDHYPSRTIVFGKDVDEITQHIKQKSQSIEQLNSKTKVNVVFVFCGVGTTWTGMCREMMTTQTVFRNKVREIDEYLVPLTGWSIAERFENDTDYSDPFLNHIAIFSTQVALYAWWGSVGVVPDFIIGQSVGEVAASYASGALPLKDAVSVIYYRSKILAEMVGGKMMVVGNYGVDKLEDLCEKHDNNVTIAVYNSPTSCTLSGDADVMDELKMELENLNEKEELGLLIRPLSVQCAYHSHHVEPCMEQIENQLKYISQGVRTIDHISTVTGELAAGEDFQTGKYWAENIRQPVKFMQCVAMAANEGMTNVYIELGPRQVLRAHLPNILGENLTGMCLPSMNGKKECVSAFSSLSEIYELGKDIDWSGVIPLTGNAVSVPKYIFNKTKLLYLPETAKQLLKGIVRNSSFHMYVSPNGGEKAEFRIEIDREATPFVYDHYFMNSLLVPGATYVEAAFEVGQIKTKCNAHELSVAVEFINPFTPADDKQYQIEIEVTENEEIDGHRYVACKDGRNLCIGTITRREVEERAIVDIAPIKERCKTYRSKEESYECLERIDFRYGETLSLIERSWSTTTECLVEFVLPESVKEQTKNTHLHPSVIDAMFQTFGILSTIGTEGPTLPKGAGSIVVNRPPQDRMFGYSQMVKATPVGNHYNSLLLSTDGHVIAEIQNFYTKTIRISDAPNESIVYDTTWKEIQMMENDENGKKINEKKGTENGMARAKLVVFGTKRFISCISPVKEQADAVFYVLNDNLVDTETMYRMAIEQVAPIRAIAFAPCHHVQYLKNANKSVFQSAKNAFLSLSLLIKVLRENNYTLPMFVVTEDVVASPDLHKSATNVCGAELWGMVRSAMGEMAYNDIRLVDMALTSENALSLEYITREDITNHNEYMLDKGRLFHSEMVECADQDQEPNQRDIEYKLTEDLVLKSSSPTKITETHFELNTTNGSIKEQTHAYVKIRLHTLCLHDSLIYPTSTESDDGEHTIWPDISDSGFQVVALEALGWQEEKNKKSAKSLEKNPKLGFCFPVDVSSVVCVPSKCTFDIGSLPVYVPGLMTTGILLWNVAEPCKHASSILVIVEDESNVQCQIITNMLSRYKNMQVTIESKEMLSDKRTDSRIATQAVLVLTKITQKYIAMIQNSCQNVKQIVSIEQFFPRYMQRWTQHNMKGVVLTILNSEKLFTYSELVEKVPKVYSWLKSIDNSLRSVLKHLSEIEDDADDDERELCVFELPYPVLPLVDGHNRSNPIPLKVFRSEVFRKLGCYILVGGLTGLGWELLQIMAELGAGYLATLSRRPPNEEKQKEIDNIKNKYGCKVICVQADITDFKMLNKAMQELVSQIGEAEIKGVFHGGGVVNDMLLSSMTEEDAAKPLLPKILGTWNLHIVTKDMPLDFFVMHSSIVAILGNPGQCNYAAGNSFQDSFAHYRRSLGMCGQSINWSTLALGMATDNKGLENNFKSQGFYYLSPEDIRNCFIRAIMTNPPQVAFGIFDWGRLELHPTLRMYPYKFETLLDKYRTKNQTFKKIDSKYNFDIEEFNQLDSSNQRVMIVDLIKAMVLDTFVVESNELDEESRFVDLGIDSMAAMSFTNSIFEAIQVRIPVVTLLSDTTTIGSLTTYIVENIQSGNTGESATTSTDNTKQLLSFIDGNVTFMQKSLLNDFIKNPRSKNFMRQADYEVKGLTLKQRDWRVILNHMLKMNPELRRVYILNKEGGGYDSTLISGDDVDVDMETVRFDSICNKNATDDRDKVEFDITKDLPIKFKIACKKDTTRMRMYMHSVISDLSGIAMLFRDIGSYIRPYVCKEPLPEKETNIVPAEAVRVSLSPRMADMKHYWKLQLAQEIKPFTFSKHGLDKRLDENNWYQITENVPPDLVDMVMSYIQKSGMSLYHFVISIYMGLLYKLTNRTLVPLVTNVDMRGHVPQLKAFVTRCINAIPVIGDLRNIGKVSGYLKRSSDRLHTMTQQSGYPYALIEEEMQTDELRKHIGRHRLVMDNMASLNQTFKHKRVRVTLSNVFHTRHTYETSLYISYDLQQNKVAFEYGYNSEAVEHGDAATIPSQLIDLMKSFIELPDASVDDILDGKIVAPSALSYQSDLKKPITITLDKDTIDGQIIRRSTKEKMQQSVDIKDFNNMKNEESQEIGKRKRKYSLVEKIMKSSISAVTELDGHRHIRDFVMIKEETLLKQTSKGWDHAVHVTLACDYTNNARGDIVLQWGKTNSNYRRSLKLNTISEVHVKKLQGLYGILMKTSKSWLVLKSPSKTQAAQWMNALKTASLNLNNGADGIYAVHL